MLKVKLHKLDNPEILERALITSEANEGEINLK